MTHEEKVREFYREQGRQEEFARILNLLDDQLLASGPLERYSASFQIGDLIRKYLQDNK
jgi:hypothetical protein